MAVTINAKLISFAILYSLIATACEYNSLPVQFNCDNANITLSIQTITNLKSCDASDGAVELLALGGNPPYRYLLNDSDASASGTFLNLTSGIYFAVVLDRNGCTSEVVSLEIKNFESKLSAISFTTADSECLENNGTAKIRPIGGVIPFQFRLDDQSDGSDSIFMNLSAGIHTILVTDAENCRYSLAVDIPREATGVSWLSDIKPIINTSCAKSGCHVSGTGRTDFTDLDNIQSAAQQIKARVINRSMPFDGSLPADQVQLIVCWVDDGAPEN